MPRPRDDPPDVPAHQDQAALSVSFDGRRCSNCGRGSNPPRHAVADFPDPTRDDPRGRLTCLQCYSELLVQEFSIGKYESQILPLMLAGYDHGQISKTVGRSKTTVERIAGELGKTKRSDRQDGLSALLEYL